MIPTILHSDLNNFYASVEILFDPALKDRPMAVSGDAEARHGIVLAKNQLAKLCGVRTGEALWQARRKCPGIVFVPAHYDRYIKYSRLAREIYMDYTDQVESFGLDECWLEVTGSADLFGDGKRIADRIRREMRRSLGLTVSVGVSFNKVFAKLGSDYKKPDATTVITRENYREIVWRLPVGDLLYVGQATVRKLRSCGIYTIGDLARADRELLHWKLGKNGVLLHRFANGQAPCGVPRWDYLPPIKSVGNSTTAPRDLVSETDVKITLYALCDSVASRLRDQGCLCSGVQLGVRDYELKGFQRQGRLSAPSANGEDLFQKAFALYRNNDPGKPVRSLSVAALGLVPTQRDIQLSMFEDEIRRQKQTLLEETVDEIRRRYGYYSIQRAVMLEDPTLNLDAKGEHTIHPIGFLGMLNQEQGGGGNS